MPPREAERQVWAKSELVCSNGGGPRSWCRSEILFRCCSASEGGIRQGTAAANPEADRAAAAAASSS